MKSSRHVLVMTIGAALICIYYLLAALEIGKFGAPTDIGGGMLALIGYAGVAYGIIGLIAARLKGRRDSGQTERPPDDG